MVIMASVFDEKQGLRIDTGSAQPLVSVGLHMHYAELKKIGNWAQLL